MKVLGLCVFAIVLVFSAIFAFKKVPDVDATCSQSMARLMLSAPWQSVVTGEILWKDGYLCAKDAGQCPDRIKILQDAQRQAQKDAAEKIAAPVKEEVQK
jgi:hypothetical protein